MSPAEEWRIGDFVGHAKRSKAAAQASQPQNGRPRWDRKDFIGNLERLGAAEPAALVALPRRDSPNRPAGNATPWGAAILRGWADGLASAPTGVRNSTLNDGGVRCYRAALAGALTADDVTATLTQAAREAGLPEAEIAATLDSARNGAERYGPADDVPADDRLFNEIVPPGDTGQLLADEHADNTEHPWRAVDLGPVLTGQWQPPVPSIGRRSDGIGLFYPGKMHTIASESDAGKTWLALAAAGDELRKGNSVLYVDFEDDESGVVGRLLTLQVSPDVIRTHFHYLRPTEALGGGVNLDDLRAIVQTRRPVLVIIDGVTEARRVRQRFRIAQGHMAIRPRCRPSRTGRRVLDRNGWIVRDVVLTRP